MESPTGPTSTDQGRTSAGRLARVGRTGAAERR